MAAFRAAVELGFRYLETDVQATKDAELVAFHDDSLDRTTGTAGRIRHLTFDELSAARIGGVEAVPRFADLLTTWPDVRINVDAKSRTSVDLLVQAIHEHEAWDRVCVASFSPLHLHRLRRMLGPRVATAYSGIGVATVLFTPNAALRLVGWRHAAQAAQVPVRHTVAGRCVDIVTPAFVDRVHALGKQVHVWTVNNAVEMHRLLDQGVDAIISDRIDILRDVYRARGIWRDTPR